MQNLDSVTKILRLVGFKGKEVHEVIGMKCQMSKMTPRGDSWFATSIISGVYCDFIDENTPCSPALSIHQMGLTFSSILIEEDGKCVIDDDVAEELDYFEIIG